MGNSRRSDTDTRAQDLPDQEKTRLGVGEVGPGRAGPPRPSDHGLDSFEQLLGLDRFEESDPDPFDDEFPTEDVGPRVRRVRRSTISNIEAIDTGVWDHAHRRQGTPSEPGERIIGGRYRLVDAVADGGMAHIFKVAHIDLGKIFALKVISREYTEDSDVRKMFEREARVASALEHPHIVQVTDYGVDKELGSYIVMEYLKGETLRNRARRQNGLPTKSAVAVLLQVAQALHYMHQQDFIHCDVKTENVFLCRPPDGGRERVIAKLIDFGLSRRIVDGARLATSELGGTPEYVSPEQIQGKAPRPSMDIYSLGVLAYEVLTGRPPFTGTPADMLFAHLNDAPVPPSQHMVEPLDEQLEQLVLRLLEKDPTKRPATMGRVAYHFRTLAEMLGALPTAQGPTTKDQARLQLAYDKLRAMVDNCPCPMFRLDSRAKIQEANRAFCEFIRLPQREVVGQSVGLTRLCYIYPEIDVEVMNAADSRAPSPIVRIVSFPGGSKGQVTVKILLVPEPTPTGRIAHFSGIIHPVDAPSSEMNGK